MPGPIARLFGVFVPDRLGAQPDFARPGSMAELLQRRFFPREATREDNRLDLAVTLLFPLLVLALLEWAVGSVAGSSDALATPTQAARAWWDLLWLNSDEGLWRVTAFTLGTAALGLAVGIVAVVVVTRVGNRPKKQDEGTDSCPARASITSR